LAGILSSINSTCARYFSGVSAIISSISNMLGLTVKVGFACDIVWMVSRSFGMTLTSTYVPDGNDIVPPLGLCAPMIYSRACLILDNSSWIRPLWCYTSSNSSVVCSWNFLATRLASSLVIIYSSGCLCALAFLREPPVCMLGLLVCVVSYGLVV
jgi:hypothetical protein